MKVILIKDLKGKGKAGEIIEVNPTYAMNVLIRQGIAKEANKSNLNDHKGQVEAKAFHHGEMVKEYLAIADKIRNKVYNFTIKVGANVKAFGSITKQEILSALNADGVKIEKNQIKDFPSIKSVGEYKITIQFIKEVSVDIVANVNIK
ncbi:MAG: 50S ribosomal protein L9 [Clostridia bacterium]|nr:50S ribosomal protein L9 [Clostridia bacterium]